LLTYINPLFIAAAQNTRTSTGSTQEAEIARYKAIIIELEKRSPVIGFRMCSPLFTIQHKPAINYDLPFNLAITGK
jgi:hypothetical protein